MPPYKMQWLFDTIRELVSLDIGFVDRGAASAPDFTLTDFTTDNAWHALALGGIIPAHSRAVLLRVRLRDNSGFKRARFRNHSLPSEWNVVQVFTAGPGYFVGYDIVVGVGSDRLIDYRFVSAIWTDIDLTVGGWWLHRIW